TAGLLGDFLDASWIEVPGGLAPHLADLFAVEILDAADGASPELFDASGIDAAHGFARGSEHELEAIGEVFGRAPARRLAGFGRGLGAFVVLGHQRILATCRRFRKTRRRPSRARISATW